jgi:hypothetical protein
MSTIVTERPTTETGQPTIPSQRNRAQHARLPRLTPAPTGSHHRTSSTGRHRARKFVRVGVVVFVLLALFVPPFVAGMSTDGTTTTLTSSSTGTSTPGGQIALGIADFLHFIASALVSILPDSVGGKLEALAAVFAAAKTAKTLRG